MFSELLAVCQDKKEKGIRIFIQTHNFPDPDAIASAFGLQQLLKKHGIDTTICYEGHIDKVNTAMMIQTFGIEMREYGELQSDMKDEDSIICVDSQKLGGNITDFIGDEVACIDHHPTYVQMEYLYSDIRLTGACASIIAEYYRQAGQTPDKATATALLYGMKMDTAQFSRGVTELDIDMFRCLFPLSDAAVISQLEHSSMELQDLKAYGAAIENIELYDFFGFSFIPFACPDAMIATVSDFILALAEVEVSVLCAERSDGLKLSARSERSDIHAGELMRKALEGIGSGGGHTAMAGGLVKAENIHLLGRYPQSALRERFLQAWKESPPAAVPAV